MNCQSIKACLTLALCMQGILLFSQIKSKPDSVKKALVQKLNAQEVVDYIYSTDVMHPEIVVRQAIYETGWFKSKHTTQKNNLFGFRHKKQYMTFPNWKASVDYYVNWQKRKYTNPVEDYYQFLIRIRYAQSPVYIQELKRVNLSSLVLPSK